MLDQPSLSQAVDSCSSTSCPRLHLRPPSPLTPVLVPACLPWSLMDHSSRPFDACDQTLNPCDKDASAASGWGSGFSLWEQECFREAEDSADQERQILTERDAINHRLWLLFQASACSIAQLYKGMSASACHPVPLSHRLSPQTGRTASPCGCRSKEPLPT